MNQMKLPALTRIFHSPSAGSGDPAYRAGFSAVVGRVPSRGAASALQAGYEISRLRATAIPILTLLFVSVMGAVLVALRIAWTHHVTYVFLIWNLMLAWLPVMFALVASRRYCAGVRGGWRFWLPSALWLLFLPNAPYIFTDLVHLENWFRSHYWVDLSLILLFAFTGFLLGFLSLYLMQQVVADKLGRLGGWVFVALAAVASGFGIYIGRFLRWNSWAILTNPLGLTYDLGYVVAHPRANYLGVVFPVLFATFMFLGYLMLYALTHLQSQRSH
jgi:uncharacterized membrane protein